MGFSSYVPLTDTKSINRSGIEIGKNVMPVTSWLMRLPHYAPASGRGLMDKTAILEVSGGSGLPRPKIAPSSIVARMKGRQCAKIRDLRQALVDAGYQSLDQQAAALGLSRSTAWAVLQGHHKASGLSAAIISRMMASPGLPPSASTVLLEYIKERSAGAYGHNGTQVNRFLRRLNANCATEASDAKSA